MAIPDTEAPVEKLAIRSIVAMETRAGRTSLDLKQASWIENLMPFGPANLRVVPPPGASISSITADTYASADYAVIGSARYLFLLTAGGYLYAQQIGVTGAMELSPSIVGPIYLTQWKSERVIISSSNALYSFDGTAFETLGSQVTGITVGAGGTGYTSAPTVTIAAPAAGGGLAATATAVLSGSVVSSVTITDPGWGYGTGETPAVSFSGGGGSGATATATTTALPFGGPVAVYDSRLWLAKGRSLTASVADSFYNFDPGAGSTTNTMTQPELRSSITALVSGADYLYVVGDSAVYAVSNVRVSGSPPVTTWSTSVVSQTVGTTFTRGVTVFQRALIVVNESGVYALYGASENKLSGAFDGLFVNVDWTKQVNVGVVDVLLRRHLALSVYLSPPGHPQGRYLLMMGTPSPWVASETAAALMHVSASNDGEFNLYAATATDVYEEFAGTSATAWSLETALYDAHDPIRSKEALSWGIEVANVGTSPITVSTDSETRSVVNQLTPGPQTFAWVDGATAFVWKDGALTYLWDVFGSLELLIRAAHIFGKYLGFSASGSALSSNGATIIGFLMTYAMREDW